MVAAYFNVTVEAIRALVHDHRAELDANGYRVLAGTELSEATQWRSVPYALPRHLLPPSRPQRRHLEGVRDDRPTVGVMDAMNGRTIEHHIAKLLRREGKP